MKGNILKNEKILLLAAGVFLGFLAWMGFSGPPPAGVQVETQFYAAASAVAPVSGEKLDINAASAEELMELPGIGEVLARRIVAYREIWGPFRQIQDVMNVRGIGEARFQAIAEEITAEEPS